MYCLLKGSFESSVYKLMFQYTIVPDLIWRTMLWYCMQIIYTEFCLNERIFLDIVKNLEVNRRKMLLERMSLKKFFS